MTDFRGKTSIFSHPVYLFLRKFSLQDSRGGSVRVENGGITYTALIPDDHVVLSVEAFIEYLERLGFKVVRE
ncbi:hypothetical protein [Escherichia coli]|uniref:hypothetical protein n=1 Tax=Escherichia coli TaxID=562 RepID=UPI0023409798|nr:hypothetical protein [Escherichia coli]